MRPKYGSWPIFEHCQPFNIARAYDEARGIEVRPRHYQLGANHHCGEGQPPRVGVEHRHDREDGVTLRQVHPGAEREPEGMEHQRAVRVQDAFGRSGGAGGVTHRDGLVFLRIREVDSRR